MIISLNNIHCIQIEVLFQFNTLQLLPNLTHFYHRHRSALSPRFLEKRVFWVSGISLECCLGLCSLTSKRCVTPIRAFALLSQISVLKFRVYFIYSKAIIYCCKKTLEMILAIHDREHKSSNQILLVWKHEHVRTPRLL